MPEEQGLVSALGAGLYYKVGTFDAVSSLLTIKNGCLMAEKYFNKGFVNFHPDLHSAGKCVPSAFMSLTCGQTCLVDPDQPFQGFFPEFADPIEDPRKWEIHVHHLPMKRSGFPCKEADKALWGTFLAGEFRRIAVK